MRIRTHESALTMWRNIAWWLTQMAPMYQPSTVKRHLADLRARSGLTTEQLIYSGRALGWLVVPSLEPA